MHETTWIIRAASSCTWSGSVFFWKGWGVSKVAINTMCLNVPITVYSQQSVCDVAQAETTVDMSSYSDAETLDWGWEGG